MPPRPPRGCGRTAARRKRSASAASAGLPSTRPSSDDRRCRTPSTSSPRRPRAPCAGRSRRPRRAGRPRSAPRRPARRPRTSMPSCSRIARRWGDARREDQPIRQRTARGRRCPISRAADSGESEPWTRLVWTSRREVAADRAGRGLERVGRADHLAGGLDRLVALEHHRDQRAAGDEVDQLAEERLARCARRSAARRARASTVICFSAAIRRPLRSKRAMISPVRPRSNASGLTRIRVLSTGASLLLVRGVRAAVGRVAARALAPRLGGACGRRRS